MASLIHNFQISDIRPIYFGRYEVYWYDNFQTDLPPLINRNVVPAFLFDFYTHHRPTLHCSATIHNAADRQTTHSAIAVGRQSYSIGGLKRKKFGLCFELISVIGRIGDEAGAVRLQINHGLLPAVSRTGKWLISASSDQSINQSSLIRERSSQSIWVWQRFWWMNKSTADDCLSDWTPQNR